MSLPHKEIVLPEIDLSHDEGDPRWHEANKPGAPETKMDGSLAPVYREDGSVRVYEYVGMHPGFWAEYWREVIVNGWADTVAAYEADPDNACDAWYYLDTHPVFWHFGKRRESLPEYHLGQLEHDGAMTSTWPEIVPHKVNPDTGRIDDDGKLNTKTVWWYEFGPRRLDGTAVHDYMLDGGADTYELALVQLAGKVWTHYGNDRRIVDSPGWQERGSDGAQE